MRAEMRYATMADYEDIHGEAALPFTRMGFVLAIDGEAVALACLRYDRGRHLIASVDMKQKARAYPLTLHRWTKKAIEAAQKTGARSFVVIADKKIPRSAAWIEHFGLKAVGETEAGMVYQWQSS